MPHSISLITTIAASLGLALLMGLLANRLRLPPIVGYLIAGVIIGPATPGFVADLELSSQLAEVGVILLMFGVGLHFSVEDLMKVRRIALPGAVVQFAVATAMGMAVGLYWQWSVGASLVFGLSLSVASTVVLIRALEQRGLLQTPNGRIAVGWLVVEDLLMVLVLVLLPPLSGWLGGGHPQASSAATIAGIDQSLLLALALALGKIALFVALMLAVGRRIFPRLLAYVASIGSRELFTLCVIAVAMGIAFGSAELFGVSFALGAFFAGMVMRESHLSHRAAQESLPFRDAFSVLFFVSVGMLFDPAVLLQQPLQVLAVVAIIIVGKSLAAFALVLAFRYPLNTALTVSASLAQIGEFSFILASLGRSLGLLSEQGMHLILAGALISISINHLVFQAVEPIQAWIRSRSKLTSVLERADDPLAKLPMSVKSQQVTGHLVLVGYGRVGRYIAKSLVEQQLPFVVAEQNRERVEVLRKQDIHAVAGDASNPAVLIQAHIVRASMLVIAIPDALRAQRMMEIARAMNPKVEILVRTNTEEEAALLAQQVDTTVFLGLHEVARSMLRHVQEKFPASGSGATPH
jgi:CPA2 family monovalent cation:H+ antiporter-2